MAARNDLSSRPADAEADASNDIDVVEMLSVVVAPRKSLIVPVKTGRQLDGGKMVDVYVSRSFGPGSVVEVSASECFLLLKNGFIEPGNQNGQRSAVPDGSAYGDQPYPTINGRDGSTLNAAPE